jgi:NTP pyrophosphatase (non-canonical NTP hydrolase)
MELDLIQKEALRIKNLYAQFERDKYGREWDNQDIFTGLVSDIGDLSRLVLAKEGLMKVENLEEAIGHEISDCLWAILVLAKNYNVNIEEVFFDNMKKLEDRIKNESEKA